MIILTLISVVYLVGGLAAGVIARRCGDFVDDADAVPHVAGVALFWPAFVLLFGLCWLINRLARMFP